VPQFYYQDMVMVPVEVGGCVEAVRRTLAEMGAKPVVTGTRVSGKLGSQLKMRLAGGAFCPARWVPIEVIVDVAEAGGQRQVVVNVADRLKVGIMLGMETKYRKHCQQTAAYIRTTIAQRLAAGG
jgi:hypothetical protein